MANKRSGNSRLDGAEVKDGEQMSETTPDNNVKLLKDHGN